jgi:hypothetical protein
MEVSRKMRMQLLCGLLNVQMKAGIAFRMDLKELKVLVIHAIIQGVQTMDNIDYKKLAKSNAILLKWRQRTAALINESNRTMFLSAFGIRKNSTIAFYIRFFRKHRKEAANLLGAAFEKDYNKMFYGEVVENELIIKFIPAIFSWMNKYQLTEDQREEIYSEMLLSLRTSVWMYLRTDVMFSTYAINGLKIGIPRAIARVREKLALNQFVSYEELSGSQEGSFAASIEDNSTSHEEIFEIQDFVAKICDDANLTEKQRESIERYLATGETDKFMFYDTRKRLRRFYKEKQEVREVIEGLLN